MPEAGPTGYRTVSSWERQAGQSPSEHRGSASLDGNVSKDKYPMQLGIGVRTSAYVGIWNELGVPQSTEFPHGLGL
jgi:hypothetical protein